MTTDIQLHFRTLKLRELSVVKMKQQLQVAFQIQMRLHSLFQIHFLELVLLDEPKF